MMKKVVAGTFGLLLILFTSLNVAFASHGGEENDRDCGYFNNAQEVMDHWNGHNYSAENDPERLDADSDGLPCEGDFPEVENINNGDDPVSSNGDQDGTENEDGEATEADEEADEDEGGALPNTATNDPLMAAVGLAMAGTGALFLARRRRLE